MDEFIRSRQCAAMKTHGLDALVAFSRENVAYGAGYIVPSQKLDIRNRKFAMVVNADGASRMLLTANEVDEAKARALVKDLRPYDEFADDPMETLVAIFAELGVKSGRIGLELDAMPAVLWDRLRALMPNGAFVDGSPVLAEARYVKSPRELGFIRKATQVAHRAQAETHKKMRDGVSEKSAARWIINSALEQGADDITMVQVASGERSVFSNPVPIDRIMRRGQDVKIDVFVTCQGYLSDTGHCVWIEEASDHERDMWKKVEEVMDELVGCVKPGMTTRELWDRYIAEFTKRGLTTPSRFLGHGLGLSLHEEPFIAEHNDIVIEPGMVMAVEPVYVEGQSLFWLEDNLLVTETGCENLTTALPHGIIVTPTGGR